MQQSQKDTLFAVSKGEKTIIARMLELNYQPDEERRMLWTCRNGTSGDKNEGQNYYDRIQQIKSLEILKMS